MVDGDDGRVLSEARLVRNRLAEILHERLEVFVGQSRPGMRKPVSSIRGPLGQAVMVKGVAIAPDSEFLHAFPRAATSLGSGCDSSDVFGESFGPSDWRLT